jgi:hypothetical protein
MRKNSMLLVIVFTMVVPILGNVPIARANTALTTTVAASPTSVEQGGNVNVTVTVKNTSSRQQTGGVVLEIYDPSNFLAYKKTWPKQSFRGNSTTSLVTNVPLAINARTGKHNATVFIQTAKTTDNAYVFDVVPEPSVNIDNNDMSKWERYVEGPSGFWIDDFAQRSTDASAPSGDSTVFHMGVHSSSSYANVYRFQRKPRTNATNFTYKVKFKWSSDPGRAPQALEFPFSVYTGSQRLEAAMQWVSGHDGHPPRWRVWAGFDAGHWTEKRRMETTGASARRSTPTCGIPSR